MGLPRSTFASVADSPLLRDILKKAFTDTISYKEFVNMPMPEGVDPDEMWNFVMMVMHCSGETRNLKSWYKGPDFSTCWSYETTSSRQDLHHISLLAHPGSRLNKIASSWKKDDRLFDYAVEEVAHCARFDGVGISDRAAHNIWVGRQPPHSDDEKIIRNAGVLFDNISKLSGAMPYSRMLIADIQHELLRGIDSERYRDSFSYHFDISVVNTDLTEDETYANELLDFEIGFAKDVEDIQDIVKVASYASTAMRDVRFVPQLRNLTEYFLRCHFFTKKNAPILMYVPATSVFDLRMGKYKRNYLSDCSLCPKEGLFTNWFHWGMVKSFREGLDTIAETLQDLERDIQMKKESIARIPSLTLRQRTFLNLAISQPNRWFKVKEYAGLYNIAYATARSELIELTNRGYLVMRKIGRANCYQIVTVSKSSQEGDMNRGL